jgi:hypothetical protein
MAERYATHLFSYRYADARWSFEIQAQSADEAKERLRALAWATYDGELIASIPVAPSRAVRLVEWLRSVALRRIRPV